VPVKSGQGGERGKEQLKAARLKKKDSRGNKTKRRHMRGGLPKRKKGTVGGEGGHFQGENGKGGVSWRSGGREMGGGISD